MAPAGPLLALLLAQPSPDLAIRPPPAGLPAPAPGEGGGGELAGAAMGALAGDAVVLGAAWITYEAFVTGATAPTAAHFRHAALGLAGAALVLPPLGAALGGALGRSGPTRGAPWKAFLLALAGQAATLASALVVAPAYWVLLPVQLTLVTVGVLFGLHVGAGPAVATPAPPRPDPVAARDGDPAHRVPFLPAICAGLG